MRAWQAADRFDDALGSLRTWLFAIIRNVVIDLSRARAVRPALATEQRSTEPISVDDDLDRILVAWQVEEALHMLSEEHRRALDRGPLHAPARITRSRARLGRAGRHGEEPGLLRAQGDAARARRAGLGRRCLTPCRDMRGDARRGGARRARAGRRGRLPGAPRRLRRLPGRAARAHLGRARASARRRRPAGVVSRTVACAGRARPRPGRARTWRRPHATPAAVRLVDRRCGCRHRRNHRPGRAPAEFRTGRHPRRASRHRRGSKRMRRCVRSGRGPRSTSTSRGSPPTSTTGCG